WRHSPRQCTSCAATAVACSSGWTTSSGMEVACWRGCSLAQPLQAACVDHLRPREQRAGVELASDLLGSIIAGGDRAGIQILVAGDVAKIGQGAAQVREQREQCIDLYRGIRFAHGLFAR